MKSTLVLLLALAAALVVASLPDLDAPFGPTHDGRNAAMWALAGDGVAEHGIVGSRLGAVHADSTTYANHPPLTGLVTAGSMAILGRDEVAVRLPGLLAALATIPLLWLVLSRILPRPAAAAGGAVALATPMFLGYGTMIDSPPLSFPIGLALLAAWTATVRREWAIALLAGAGVLVGWQAALLAGVLLAVELGRALRTRRPPGWGLPAGFATGVALLGAWLLWVHGSIGPMLDQLTYRSGNGGSTVGLGDSIDEQLSDLRAGFPLVVLVAAAAGCVLAVRRSSTRTVAVAAMVVVAGYSLVLRQAAFYHPYWNYWALLPIAVGLGAVAASVLTIPTPLARHGLSALAAVAIAVAAVSPLPVRDEVRAAGAAAAPLQATRLAADQRTLWLIGHFEPPVSWVQFYARRSVHQLTRVSELERLRRTHPDHIVLIGDSCYDGAICAAIDDGGPPRYRLERVTRLREV